MKWVGGGRGCVTKYAGQGTSLPGVARCVTWPEQQLTLGAEAYGNPHLCIQSARGGRQKDR